MPKYIKKGLASICIIPCIADKTILFLKNELGSGN